MLLLREVTAVDTDLLSQFGFICAVCTILLVHDKHKYIVQFRVSGEILHQLNSTPDELGVLDKHLCLMASRIAFQCVAALCENPQRPVLVSNGRIDAAAPLCYGRGKQLLLFLLRPHSVLVA